jgi:iron-sulfur cluster assembly protein
MAIIVTERAAKEVMRIREEQKLEVEKFLRVGVAGGGCGGFNYTLQFDETFNERTDSKHHCHGLQVVVDKKSALYLDGAKIDWYEDPDRRGFTFDNPNAVRTCSCGGSP